ncbi:MAG: acyltransferase [Halopseudomonas sp.]
MTHRPEIDGLRAVAIIPVLLFHAGLPYFTGGYIGVDVFFVISGFLITKIIITQIEKNNLSLLEFYERRARRIIPALVVMVVLVSVFMPFFTDSPKRLNEFGSSAISVTFFMSNIYFFLSSGYFGTASELSPLLHTWSLAVEEQFYLIFPLLAVLCLRFGKQYFTYVILLIIIASLVVAEWGWRNSSIGNFYLAPTRAWELLIGSIGAVIIDKQQVALLEDKFKSYLSSVGLLMVVSSYFLFTPETPHPSIITIIPVLGTIFVILFSNNNICGNILRHGVLVHIGLISYSLYLWHQPILAFAKMKFSEDLGLVAQAIVFTLIYAVSALSYKCIETPFRDNNVFLRADIYKYSAASLVLMCFVGVLYISNVSIRKYFYPEDMSRYEMMLVSADSHEHQIDYEDECKFRYSSLNEQFKERFNDCSIKHGKAIFILGGSHGIDLYNAIAMNSNNEFIVSLSRGFCRAHDFIGELAYKPKCQYEDFKEFASMNFDNIMKVIYTQTPDRLFTKDINVASEAHLSVSHVDQVVDYLSRLKEIYDLDVLMVGMLPPMKKSPIELDYKIDLKPQLENNFSNNAIIMTRYTDAVFKEKLKKHGIDYISKFDGFELDFSRDMISNGEITYSDHRHISTEGERLFGSRLVNKLNI